MQQLTTSKLLLQCAQTLFEQEKQLHALDKRVSDQALHLEVLEERLDTIDEQLAQLPQQEPIPTRLIRADLNELIRVYACKSKQPYHIVWRKLYREYFYRYRVDLQRRARNRGVSVCVYAEQDGFIQSLYALAKLMYTEVGEDTV